ncbi:Demethylsterigmatocystin 6-O-methyltransferase [Diaporthe amygdali]|uniref:Demethylsterigmatocystin 6-O-methyltransferase n=1 Tax=Phomopsis amygdali TaxID=1214568 RepID=UPI0022FDF341|nr:Demethylsterigmatocystin 6-O-methyltransferase [Diaporthe amygdali]KAJ0117894.1 Demethylsterigmatocystin 6-O-methyltransferase [Diaporthe amygdali]
MASYISETTKQLDSIRPDAFQSDAERYEVKEATRRLLARLETPFERGWALTMETAVLVPGLLVFQDLGIWSKWAEIQKGQGPIPQSLSHIVEMCSAPAEPNLLLDEWKPTSFSLAMGDESTYTNELVRCGFLHCNPCGLNLPSFLAKNQYREPLDTKKFDNHTDTFGSVFFDYCQQNHTAGSNFIGMMTAVRSHKMDWTEVYDTAGLVDGADLTGKSPFFVDIGGAHGLDTARLLSKHPDLPQGAGLVVQDLPEVTSTHGAKEQLDPRIARMAYDFFTPQPLAGARSYFFHAVLHDWPDEDCVRIFENVKGAMKHGYSKLLIYENVLPAKGAASLVTTLDLLMMNSVCGLERTEGHWRRLLEGSGLRVVGISRHPRAIESVIEVELP